MKPHVYTIQVDGREEPLLIVTTLVRLAASLTIHLPNPYDEPLIVSLNARMKRLQRDRLRTEGLQRTNIPSQLGPADVSRRALGDDTELVIEYDSIYPVYGDAVDGVTNRISVTATSPAGSLNVWISGNIDDPEGAITSSHELTGDDFPVEITPAT